MVIKADTGRMVTLTTWLRSHHTQRASVGAAGIRERQWARRQRARLPQPELPRQRETLGGEIIAVIVAF